MREEWYKFRKQVIKNIISVNYLKKLSIFLINMSKIDKYFNNT